jgi:dienelactone hydrolase
MQQSSVDAQTETLGGLSAYIAKPDKAAPGSPAILLIHDIFGWEHKNARLYADKMAKHGARGMASRR